MKRLLFALCLCLFAAFAHGQDVIKEKQVPPDIREDFEFRFHNAEDITWLKQADQYYGARFTLEGDAAEAVYTREGTWIQTEEIIHYREMPDSARKYCRHNYPEYQAKDIKKVSTRKYGILYEILIRGDRKQIGMTFDMHGKLLQENAEEIEALEAQKQKGIKGKLNKLLRKKDS